MSTPVQRLHNTFTLKNENCISVLEKILGPDGAKLANLDGEEFNTEFEKYAGPDRKEVLQLVHQLAAYYEFRKYLKSQHL